MKYSRPKGTRDLYGKQMEKFQYLEYVANYVCESHNFNKISTPVFENTELFKRSVGDESDIVNKEMYTFLDKGNRSITLRPELTAGVVRSYIENGFSSMPSPMKLYYLSSMYRYEKMQKGRYREFFQFGAEIFGSKSVLADIESIVISSEIIKGLGLDKKVSLNINSIGCKTCRKEYILKIKELLKDNIDNMCDDCKTRYIKNPLRILDCKKTECKKYIKDLPSITDELCEECSNDFESLKTNLSKLKIPYNVDKSIVRGLDYYNKTVYEYISNDLDIAVGGGGRYDDLVKLLDGPNTPAVGFALGVDRLMLLMDDISYKNDVIYIISDDIAKANEIADDLRKLNYRVEFDISNRSFNANMKYANKINSKFVIILKEDEIKQNICVIKNMEDGKESKVKLDTESISEYFFSTQE